MTNEAKTALTKPDILIKLYDSYLAMDWRFLIVKPLLRDWKMKIRLAPTCFLSRKLNVSLHRTSHQCVALISAGQWE